MKKAIIAAVIALLVLSLFQPKDDTDQQNMNPFDRSGMTLHKDNLTGCEYLGRAWGTLTPRLDASGKHICRKIGGAQ